MTIYDGLKEDIKILERELKCEEDILGILKVRFTKKEYKFYMMKLEGLSVESVCKELNIDLDRYTQISDTVIKKLNSEKLKYELSTKVK
jgi:hypothetical protein